MSNPDRSREGDGKAMSRVSRGIVAASTLAALVFGWSPAKAAEPSPPPECAPTQTFSTVINNEYAPMLPGQVSTFFGLDGKVRLGLQIEVLNQSGEPVTQPFYGAANDGIPTVTTIVVRETEWVDKNADGVIDPKERLIEVSDNYFAQTAEGTVCYFGEDVQIYKSGKFRGDTSGSWRADDPGNAPGIFMAANPTEGQSWQTEFAPDVAMDTAEVVEDGLTVEVPADEYSNAIEVKDCNPLEPPPDNCGTKYYAPGVGLIIDGPVELTSFNA
jgi:hypothetical protein